MSYGAGEALLLALIRNISSGGYDANNTSRGKWGLLNKGRSNHYAILKPGAFGPRVHEGVGLVIENWSTVIQVWQRYKDDGDSLTDLEAEVEKIIAKIDTDPNMGDTTGLVLDTNLRRGGEVQEMWKRGGGGPAWLMQELVVEWSEQRTVVYQ